MTDKLERVIGNKAEEYHEHCRNIAHIISRSDNASIDLRVYKYLLTVGITL